MPGEVGRPREVTAINCREYDMDSADVLFNVADVGRRRLERSAQPPYFTRINTSFDTAGPRPNRDCASIVSTYKPGASPLSGMVAT